jgi:hypothetical protein
MKRLLFVIMSIVIMAGNCEKAGPDCHFYITIINNSNQDVIEALIWKNTSGKCNLSGSIINSLGKYEFRLNDCWEDELASGRSQEIYIVDPTHFNAATVFYDCDSLELKNTILKHYSLTLDDLKSTDFTVTFQ